MRSSSGTSAVLERAVVVAACLMLLSPPAAAIDFDAIFYRARAGFDFCYEFTGTAGWSLRAIEGGRISHDSRDPCPTTGLSESQLAASGDCSGGTCHADCASFVRRAWAAGTDELLRPLAAPGGGNCADPSSSGADHFAQADAAPATITAALGEARPGDWCSHADHVLMLVRRVSPNASRWVIWEANSAALGIGQSTIGLDYTWLRRIVRDDCKWTDGPADPSATRADGAWLHPEKAWKNSGCWHPPADRTGPPLDRALLTGDDEVGQDGVLHLDALPQAKLRFRRPADLPALADYLVWVRWKSGGSDDAPTWEHRLVRIPAFSRRSDAARRFATFPEVPPGVRDFPLDIDEASVIEVSLDDLVAAPTTVVTRFHNPVTGELADRWQPGLGLTPVVPALFQGGPLEFSAGRSYAWRVRVERYGELSADGRQRVAVMRGCSLAASGQEQVDYCRDPRWSEEHRFTLVCAEVDDSCPRSAAGGEECTPAPGRPEDRWTSGCAQMSLGSATAHADGFVDANIETFSGICSGVGVWAAPSDYAIFNGAEVREEEQHRSIYDFCYDVSEQPKPAPGPAVVVVVPDDWSGTVRFHVPATTGSEGCIDYIGPDQGGTCCLWGGGCRAQGEFDGPMVVAGGSGGTHGWSTVRMFSVVPAGITADPGTP